MKKNSPRLVSSIENSSILRKFTVLFLIMSLIPVCVLFYFYTQIKTTGGIDITEENFNLTLTIIVLGVMVGYFAMRAVVKQLMDLTQKNAQVLKTILTTEDLKEIGKGENEIAVLAQSFSVITERLEENLKTLERTKNTLHTVMAKVAQGVSSMQNIDSFLQLILETATAALGGKTGALMLFEENAKELHVKSVYGDISLDSKDITIKLSDDVTLSMVLSSKRPIVIPVVSENSVPSGAPQGLFQAPLLCAPLMIQDKVKGLISISGRKTAGNFNDDEMNLLLNISSQTAVAIENSRLNEDIEKTYFETISALALAVDAKDAYSRGHLDRVAQYSVMIGEKLGLDESEIKILRDAAKLHDVGKIGIADDILCKNGPLNDEEWIVMHKHPEIGESIVKPVSSLRVLCDIIRHHHEKLDGTGYPDGLKGEELSP